MIYRRLDWQDEKPVVDYYFSSTAKICTGYDTEVIFDKENITQNAQNESITEVSYITLTERDKEHFVDIIESPPDASIALKETYKKYNNNK